MITFVEDCKIKLYGYEEETNNRNYKACGASKGEARTGGED